MMTCLPANPAAIEEAARIIRAGGIVAVPTDTLYGLAADPFSEAAIARVFAVKGRTAERALPLIAADADQVQSSLGALPPLARALAHAFWPGPLTLLIEAPATLAADVSGGTGRVGVRVPAHAVARAVCRACASLLTATSANISGEPAVDDPREVERTLGARIDLLIDAGKTNGGPPSTIVDVTGSTPRLVRAGAVAWNEVLTCLDRR
jgi:L-threonylcarbamoyladenylate synthase